MVKRLRWWHRNRAWRGCNGWVYTWERPNWAGYKPGKPHLDWVYLRPDLDTANYGPYEPVVSGPWSQGPGGGIVISTNEGLGEIGEP